MDDTDIACTTQLTADELDIQDLSIISVDPDDIDSEIDNTTNTPGSVVERVTVEEVTSNLTK